MLKDEVGFALFTSFLIIRYSSLVIPDFFDCRVANDDC